MITTYSYYGSTTVVADGAGNWKSLTNDVDGNLISVIERQSDLDCVRVRL